MTAPTRRALIAKIKIAQKSLSLDDVTYRALLTAVTGKDSCAKCTDRQLIAVLVELRNKGWNPAGYPAVPGRDAAAPKVRRELIPLHSKIRAQLADLDKPRNYADGILARMFGVSLDTADNRQLTASIAALTRQQERRTA